jgi:hypothetical protein
MPVARGERLESFEGLQRLGAEFGERVIDARRNGGIAGTTDEAVTFKRPEARRQRLL